MVTLHMNSQIQLAIFNTKFIQVYIVHNNGAQIERRIKINTIE